MSGSTSPKTNEKSPTLPVIVLILSVVLIRVWYVAEQLRLHYPSSMSTHWVDSNGADHTITISTSPGHSFQEFLVEYDHALQDAQRQFPRKP